MQCIDHSFKVFLKRHFQFACDIPYSTNVVKYGLEAVKLGLLDKDCVNIIGDCLACVLIEHAYVSRDLEACIPFLCQFFDMKPCLQKVWFCLTQQLPMNPQFFQFCLSIHYLWTDPSAIQKCWFVIAKCPLWKRHWMHIQNNWSPCREAWIWAVVQ